MSRQKSGRWSLKHAMPSRAMSLEVETAQMRDLILNGSFGRGTTVATLLSHRVTPPASLARQRRTKPFHPGCGRPGLFRLVRKQDLDRASFEQHRQEIRAPSAVAIPLQL